MKSEGVVQFVKFGVVGVANTVVDWIVFYILLNTIVTLEPAAKAIAFLVAMLNSYIWNTIWTFRKEYKSASTQKGAKTVIFSKFAIVSGLGWGLNVAVFSLVLTRVNYQLFGNEELLALVAASAAATLWNFFANKFWTYKK